MKNHIKNDIKNHIKNDIHINLDPSPFRKTRGARVRKIIADIFLGLAVIAVGIGYLGNHLSFLPWEGFTLFFPGWGSLFLIVPALYWLIRRPLSWFWPVCLLIGVLILLANREHYSFGTAAAIVLAAFVILVGLRIIFAPVFKRLRQKKMKTQWQKLAGQSDHVVFTSADGGATCDREYSVAFGDRTVNIRDQEFTAATVSCKFGNMVFIINQATITDCAVIDATCSFGNLELHLPAGARTEVASSFHIGNFENHHVNPTTDGAPVIYINLDGSYGNVEIF